MISAINHPFLKRFHFKTIVFIVIAITILGCTGRIKETSDPSVKTENAESAHADELPEVTFLPDWVANAQYAGYYMAEETGIYKKYGMKVKIISYQPFITSRDLIKEGKADFAVLWLADALELKASGVDIVNIAQLSSRSSLMLITKKKSGIKTLNDMNGKKIGIWSESELQPKALFNKYHLDVNIIPIGSSNNLFLRDGVDITCANWFDEYNSIINSGLNADELNTFFFADYGLNFLEDGIYCLSDKLKKDPKLCADFVNATLEGWMYAFDNPEKVVDVVVNHAKKDKLPVNRIHQQWMLDRYKDLYFPNGKTAINTNLSAKDYEFVGTVLKENGLIKQIPSYENFYQPVIKGH